MTISIQQCRILELLDETGGFTAGQVALRTRGAGRRHSADVRQLILQLHRAGLIAEIDALHPVCWKRTPLGTRELQAAVHRGPLQPSSAF